MKAKNDNIEYPRHWWFSCSKFTCYLQTDEKNNVGGNSSGMAKAWTGKPAKEFAKSTQRKYGGVMVNEYDKAGRWI